MFHHFNEILLCITFLLSSSSSSSYLNSIQVKHFKHLHYYHLYGNELTVANHYFNLTSYFEQSNYFKDFEGIT